MLYHRVEQEKMDSEMIFLPTIDGTDKTGAGSLGDYLVLVDPKNTSDRKTVLIKYWYSLRPWNLKPPVGKLDSMIL